MHISLRAGERFYVNGAVLRVDRKVTVELLNDVTFLLEAHVLQAEQATTPLRQLYFIVQAMLIDPAKGAETQRMFQEVHRLLVSSFRNEAVLTGLARVHQLVSAGRPFEALKTIRVLFPIEDEILVASPAPLPTQRDQSEGPHPCK